ncbi:MAG: CxxxxCH/CxxCH domain-containing protein, partial [Deltaproteobacteria bacterium]|nr:CxxxxCH/CxxCH domain-containing protein [Deltaproteobacteria bacterium]
MGKMLANKFDGMSFRTRIGLVFMLLLGGILYQGVIGPLISDSATSTYYFTTATSINVGVDGSTQTTATRGGKIAMTTGTYNSSRYVSAAANTNWQVLTNVYGPAYATSQTVSAPELTIGTRDFNGTSNQIYWKADVYDYNPAGTAGNGVLLWSTTGEDEAHSFATSAKQLTFTSTAATPIVAGHRLKVVISARMTSTNSSARLYWGSSTNYSFLKVTEANTAANTVTVTNLNDYNGGGLTSVLQGEQNVAMLQFHLYSNAATEWTGGKLDKIGSNTVLNDATFYIYKDANDNDAFDSVSDTNIGGPYNFSQATGAPYTLAVPQTLDATPQHYFVVFTIDGNATTLTTIGSRIQNNSYFTVTNGLSVSTITSTSSSLPTINSVGSAVNKNYATDWDSGTALLLPESGGESATDSPCITTSVTNPIGTNLVGLLNFPSHSCTSVSGRTNRSSEANPNFVTLYFNGISGYPNNMITVKGVSLKFRTRGTGQFAVQLFYVKPDGTRVNSPVTSTVSSSGTTTVLRTLTLAGQTFTNVPAGSRLGVRIGVSASGMGVGLGGADATQLAMQETAGVNTNVNIGNGSAIADGNVTASSTDNVVNSFTLAAVSGNQTVTSVTVTGNAATNSSNVALVKLYADKGTVGALDGNDTLLGSASLSGNSATINVNEVVGATFKRYLLAYDITAAPATGSVLNGTVTGLGGVTPGNNTDAYSAKLTVVATTTVTNGSSEPASVPLPSGGSATNIDAFGLNINGGSNDSISTVSVALLPAGISAKIARVEIVDRISGTVYGSLTAPTSGDDWRVSTAGLEATAATRECYVRITPKANIATVYSTTALVTSISHSKTQNGVVINDSSSATVTLDGQAPSDPVLTATSGAAEGTIQLNWTTANDSSGLHGTQAYTLVRGNVNAPAPVNCSSGTLVYQGSALSILDSGSVGQSYSYRACARDTVGNTSPGTRSSAMAAVPTVCNTAPSISVNPVTSFVKPGQPVQLTVGLSNNDTGACSGTTFTLSLVGTENSADFTTPSVLGTNTFNLPANGGGASTTLTITAKAGAPQNSTNSFTIRASAAGHPSADTAAPVIVTVNDFGTMIHSSLQLGTQRFGSWGVNYNCETCHSPEGGNIKQVRDVITTPQGDRPVIFSTVSAAHTVTTGVFGNDTKNETLSTNVCSVCHHNTRFHQYSASKVAWKEHNNSADCIRCHPHNKGFKGEGVVASCDECHGNPPVSAATMASPATNALYPFATNAGAHGKHNPHMNCLTCHSNSNHSGSPTPTGNTNLEMGFSISAANFPGFIGSIESGQFTGSNTLNTQYHWSAGPGTTLLQAANTTTCSVYCHGWPGSGGSNSTPSWIGSEQKGCGTCHDATGANPPQSGSHIKHTGTTIGNNGIACVKCHATYSNYSTSISHTNGIVEWNLSQISGIAAYKGANSGNTGTPAPSGSYGSCSNLYCHSNVQSANGTAGPTFYDNPSWGGSTNCNNCHPGNPNTTAGHPQHVSDANTSFDCRICHGSGGDANPLNHANGRIDFDFSGLGANTVYSKGAYKTPGSGGFGSCSNSDCHGRQNISWAAASALPLCDKCHGSSNTASFYGTGGPTSTTSNTDPQVGAHTLHIKNAPYAYSSPLDCGECHVKPAGPYSPGHIDNALPGEIQFGAIAARGVLSGYSSLPSYNAGRECNNTWCHGAGMDSNTGKGAYAAVVEDGGALAVPTTPVWNVPYLNGNANNDCSRCHGYPPSAPGPGYNHYLKTATSCIECHKHVNAAGDGFTNASLHVNGMVDSCNTCHGRPPIDMAGLTVPALNAMRPEQVGAHNAHLLNPNIGGDCAVCHNNYTSTMPSNAMEMGFNAYAGRVSGGTFWGYSTLTNNVYVSSSVGTTVRRTNDETKQNSCTNLYCHGGGTPLGNSMNTQPNWELGSGEASCGSCHGVSAVTPPTLGSHIKHASASGLALSCDTCHGVIENNYHVNGSVEWEFYTSARVGINATYTPAVGSAGHSGGTNALAPSSSYGSCSLVYCHSDGKGAYKTIQWGSAGPLGCGSCHNDQTANPTMSHAKHITTYGIACSTCHNGAGSGTEKHVDGTIDVIFNTGIVGASAQYDNGSKNCFSIVCHVSTASTGPTWSNAGSLTTYPATCFACHSQAQGPRAAAVVQFNNGNLSGNSH